MAGVERSSPPAASSGKAVTRNLFFHVGADAIKSLPLHAGGELRSTPATQESTKPQSRMSQGKGFEAIDLYDHSSPIAAI